MTSIWVISMQLSCQVGERCRTWSLIIYTVPSDDFRYPSTVNFKLGHSKVLEKRLNQHFKNCTNDRRTMTLRGFWPGDLNRFSSNIEENKLPANFSTAVRDGIPFRVLLESWVISCSNSVLSYAELMNRLVLVHLQDLMRYEQYKYDNFKTTKFYDMLPALQRQTKDHSWERPADQPCICECHMQKNFGINPTLTLRMKANVIIRQWLIRR